MITLIQSLAAGNALRVFLEPRADADGWCLLRKRTDDFIGQADPDAVVVSIGGDNVVLDIFNLANETEYFYRPYYRIGTRWVAGESVAATPSASYEDIGVDVPSFVRERIDLGLQEEVRRGTLVHEHGRIRVLDAPPPLDDTIWPVVTVHLSNDQPGERAIGEMITGDEFDGDQWLQKEGWLSSIQINIMGWSLNPDERKELRKALKRIIQANLPIFDFAGMVQIEFSQQDTEDFGSFSAPVYQVLCTLSCLAPSQVGSRVGAVKEVFSTIRGN